MRLTRLELIFTVGLTTNFDACMPNVEYILMSASALCIHVGMSECSTRPFVRQSAASARLSVRLMIVYHLSSVRPSVCLSVCMFTCSHVPMYRRTSVCTVDIEN